MSGSVESTSRENVVEAVIRYAELSRKRQRPDVLCGAPDTTPQKAFYGNV